MRRQGSSEFISGTKIRKNAASQNNDIYASKLV